MAPPTVLFLLIASFFPSPPTHLQVQAADQAFASVVISQKCLGFLKEFPLPIIHGFTLQNARVQESWSAGT
ncbi:hypothetical protein ACFX2C_024169 [Malus domestica]